MENMAKKFRDQPHNPLQTALYWVEYALRHNATNGADFLNPKSRFMCSLIAYSVDVELFIVSVVVTSLLATIIVAFKLVCSLRLSKNVNSKSNKKKKKQ